MKCKVTLVVEPWDAYEEDIKIQREFFMGDCSEFDLDVVCVQHYGSKYLVTYTGEFYSICNFINCFYKDADNLKRMIKVI